MNIIIEPPAEVNPVELICLAQSKNPKLTYDDFAIAFGCKSNTIAKWMCGNRQPAQAHRIWAAELQSKWLLSDSSLCP